MMEVNTQETRVRKGLLKSDIKKYIEKYGILLGFLLICIFLSFASPVFMTTDNLINIMKQVSIIGIVSMGMTMIIISGGIDLSVGSVLALTSVLAAVFASSGIPMILVIILSIFAGGIVGFLNGYVTAKGVIAPFIVTLGMMTIARGLALLFSNGMPVTGFSDSFLLIGRGEILGLPAPIYIFLVIIIITTVILKKTKLGRHIYAIGGNEQAALVSGINISKVKIMVYVIGGLFTGLAGIVLAARVGSGQPNAAVGYELDAIAAVVIGGVSFTGGIGHPLGTLLGTLIIGVINNGLDLMNVQAYYQQIIKGLIIVVAVFLDKNRAK